MWSRDFARVSESESGDHISRRRLNAEQREGNHTRVTKLFWRPFPPNESCYPKLTSAQVQIRSLPLKHRDRLPRVYCARVRVMRTRLATGRPSTSAGINFHSSVDRLRYSEASCLPETLTDRTLPAESTTKFTRTFPFKSGASVAPDGG